VGTQEAVVASVTESRWGRAAGVLREITAGGLAGLIAGVIVAGVGGRLVMRLTSLAASSSTGRTTGSGFRVGTVTIGGSLEVLLFIGLGSGLLGGIMLVTLWPWVSEWGRWRGIAVGGYVLAMGSTTVIEPHNIDFFILGNRAFLVALFLALFFAWSHLAVWFRDLLERQLPKGSRGSTIAYVLVTLVGLLLLPVLPFTLFDSDSDVPLVVGASVMLVAIATLAVWVIRIWEIRGPAIRAAHWAGYAGFGAALVFGLLRAVSDALEIIN
jgi:MFS family permease